MGCTSSAPTVAIPDANTASEETVNIEQKLQEKNINNQEKMSKEDQNETNDSNVLPKCDTISEPIQVFSHNKSLTDLRSLENMRENHEMENGEENNKDNTPVDTLHDDKISSLENIVKRVIESKVTENIMNHGGNSHNEDHNIEQTSQEHDSAITLQLNNILLTNIEDVEKAFLLVKVALFILRLIFFTFTFTFFRC
ncbi:hypothetical protein O3G_MSEX013355 [Manduca sexta]|uniref:Uncharacterized protein n=1 Tax=Manduca sexta TaxID=7130 RepID=A0A922CZ54_MANSE|nr:hypothetical protein O3G_MSEX013355 [Manduca sexta]